MHLMGRKKKKKKQEREVEFYEERDSDMACIRKV
jgi:hypothetical protein